MFLISLRSLLWARSAVESCLLNRVCIVFRPFHFCLSLPEQLLTAEAIVGLELLDRCCHRTTLCLAAVRLAVGRVQLEDPSV